MGREKDLELENSGLVIGVPAHGRSLYLMTIKGPFQPKPLPAYPKFSGAGWLPA